MSEYDFKQLSYYDFEILVRDLLQAELSIPIESFKRGRDQGIDLRYAEGADKLIVQAKHYARSTFSDLKHSLSKEDPKVAKLKPSRYIVATSLPLSPQDKDDIISVLPSAPLKSGDVLGLEGINNLLVKHPNIERSHPKLWLTSTAVLQQILHNAEYAQSRFEVQRIHKNICKYVQTGAFRKAEEYLAKESIVMIAGAPGIGKTTLAQMLLYEHLHQGWQAVVIERDINEGKKLFHPDEKQIFYFDDFVGATLVGEGVNANDKALLNFISMIRDSASSRLVLTTRDHLFERARQRSEKLRAANLDADRIILRMPDYTGVQRAQILYNHIYFGDLPEGHVNALLKENFYKKIIRHERFNPRVIEWLASFQRVRHVPDDEYQDFIEALLENPAEIWRHAFEEELTNAARSLILALWTFEGRIAQHILQDAFVRLHKLRAEKYGFDHSPEDFKRALKELLGSFIQFGQYGSVEVADPSVLDLMNVIIGEGTEHIEDLLLGAIRFVQIERLWKFSRGSNAKQKAWRRNSADIASRINALMLANRKVKQGKGIAWLGPSYEARLVIVLSITANLGSEAYDWLIDPLFAKAMEVDPDSFADLGDMVRLLKTLQAKTFKTLERMRVPLRARIFHEAKTAHSSQQICDILDAVQGTLSPSEAVSLRRGFVHYQEKYFSSELDECDSRDDFESIIYDLEKIQDRLELDVDDMHSVVSDALEEFEEEEEMRGDAQIDDYKERRYEQRVEETSISDMFDTLGDRE